MRRRGRTLLVLTTVLLLAPSTARAAARLHDWLGTYAMNHDGFPGTLTIADSKVECGGPPWCALVMRYVDQRGRSHRGRVDRVDDSWQHMVFTIGFPGNPQRFDAHLFSWDKTKMAGTTSWRGRTFGFYATRGEPAAAPAEPPAPPVPGADRRILPDGTVEVRRPDGTIVRRARGSTEIIRPDGTRSRMSAVEVTVAMPPVPPPGSDLHAWLQAHARRLLDDIGLLVGNDSEMIADYVRAEGPADSPFETIDKRARTIGFLLAP